LWYQIGFLTLAFLVGAYIGGLANLRLIRERGGRIILYPASRCETCVTPGPFYSRIPLFWYLILWGKCRRCGHPLPLNNLIYELVGGVILAGSIAIYGFSITTLTSLLSAFILLTVTILDFRYRLVPQNIVLIGLIAAGITAVLPGGIGLLNCIGGAMLGGGLILLLVELHYIELIPVEGLNFVKMMTIAGAFLGLTEGLLAFGVAAAMWGAWRVATVLMGKKPELLPAGVPALITTALVLAYGSMFLETLISA
jgi:leader peptidase (prepilin peptidase) / N-methyltransferase